jgi:hypothetical protein
MLVDNLINKPLEKQQSKRVETDYIEELDIEFQKFFIKQVNSRISSYIDSSVGSKKYLSSLTELKQKTRTRNLQKQRTHRNYQLLSRLGRIYNLSSSSKLLRFFDENRALIPVVIEAHEELKKRFPSEEFTLEVVSDPEADGCDELFAYILTSLPVEDALQRLNDLDEEWFLNQLDRTNGLFNFNLRFI